MSRSRYGAHRHTPPARSHRPVQRGRHRLMDHQRAGVRYVRIASAAVMLLMAFAGHFLGEPRRQRPAARRA